MSCTSKKKKDSNIVSSKKSEVNSISHYFFKIPQEMSKSSTSNSNDKISEQAVVLSSMSPSVADSLELNTPSTSVRAAINKPQDICASNFYHGKKLDLDFLLKSYPFLKKCVQVQNGRNRIFVSCTICKTFFDEASKVAKNGVIPIASGVRADCAEKLARIIDHLESAVHKAAEDAKKVQNYGINSLISTRGSKL